MADCKHENFAASVDVNRLEDAGERRGMRYSADVRIECAECGKKMRFIGLPMGLDLNGAAVSPDGTEGRFAIHPVGEPVPGLSDDVPAGFRIMQQPNER